MTAKTLLTREVMQKSLATLPLVRLGEPAVAQLVMGQSPPSSTYNTKAIGLPFFQGKTDFGYFSPIPRIWCSAPSRTGLAGDILISVRAPVGDVNLATEECALGRGIAAIRASKDVNGIYLYYALQFSKSELVAASSGAIFESVNKTELHDLEVPLPGKPEQEKIAAVLWKLQRAIATQDRLITTTRDLKQSALAQLFTHGLRDEHRKETPIGLIPESWRVAPLLELAHFQRGFDITKKQQTAGNIPVVSSGGIKSWHTESKAKGPGVVIGRKGSIGTVYYVDRDYWPHDTSLWATDFRGNLPLFVYYRLSVLDLARLDSGAANPALNRNSLHEEIVSWPNPDEQLAIAAALTTIDRKLAHHHKKRAALNDLFQTLLHKLMTGEIRVTDIDIDTSEVTASSKVSP